MSSLISLFSVSSDLFLETQHLVGKFALHPFINRRMPIVADAIVVDMEFGTGAVKMTPAHDPNDYDAGMRNNLEFINILNDDGTMNANAGPVYEVRIQLFTLCGVG